MFDIVEKNQKLVKGIMIAVGASFVLWGIGSYLGMVSDDGYLAKVGSKKIYMRDIDQAMQNDPNQDKLQLLYGLVNRQLLLNNFADNHMVADTDELKQTIAQIPAFQNSQGQFQLSKYKEFLKSRYMTAEDFQNEVSQQILLEQTINVFKNSYFDSKLFQKKFVDLLSQERNVSSYVISSNQFTDKVKISESQIAEYYKQNIAHYTIPEKVKMQYLVLDSNNVANGIKVSEAEVERYMADHKSDNINEQIDVSHILFVVPENADMKTRDEIKAHAQKVLAEVKANPDKFAELAKKYSQDPGSAKKGGDLGFFGHGVMVKPFEDAAFSLKVGQISGLVKTQYGYHILKLNKIKENSQAAVKQAAIAEIQKQRAILETQKQLEQLNDITYNQAKSLEPAAQKLGLKVQSSDWVMKGVASGDFANPKVQAAIFNPDVIQKGNNSEVVDLGKGKYEVYHVTEYQKPQIQSLNEVSEAIKNILIKQKTTELANLDGQTKLAQLQSGKLQLNFANPVNVDMVNPNIYIDSSAVRQIFSVSSAKLPAYVGMQNTKGDYVIYRINSVTTSSKLIAENTKAVSKMEQDNAMLDMNAYIIYLRSKYSIDIKPNRLLQQSK